jgi:hypothetical protein
VKRILIVLLVGMILATSYVQAAPPDPLGASSPSPDWQIIRSPNFIYYLRDPSIQPAVEELSRQDEEFRSFLSQTFQVTVTLYPIQTYIFTDWQTALQENLRLPETAIWNIYEQGVFERTNAQSLLVRRLVADSASFIHSGVMTSLQYRFRGQDPHVPALLYRAMGELQPPEKMMFQPYSQHALVTYASFLTFLEDRYGATKLKDLMYGVRSEVYYGSGRTGEFEKTWLFLDEVQRIYGRKLEDLSQDWLAFLAPMQAPSNIDPKMYYEISQYLNTVGMNYYRWQDFPNFFELMSDTALLYYWFDRLDLEKSQIYYQRLLEGDAQGQWVVNAPTRYAIGGGIGLGVIVLAIIGYFIWKSWRRGRQMRALAKAAQQEQSAFSEFLGDRTKEPPAQQ